MCKPILFPGTNYYTSKPGLFKLVDLGCENEPARKVSNPVFNLPRIIEHFFTTELLQQPGCLLKEISL